MTFEYADPKWRDLYRIGGIACIVIAASVTFAIAAYFIWPYQDSVIAMETIFGLLQEDCLGGLLSLDLAMLIIAPINILMFLALYAGLRKQNESYALVALVLALIAVVLVIQARPLAELVLLSEKYAGAEDAAEQMLYLSAGSALHSYFSGTAWIIQTAFFMVAGLINCLLMLRVTYFRRVTAVLGIANSVVGLGFFLPGIGLPLLFLNTIGTIPWCILLASDFFRLVKMKKPVSAHEEIN